MMVPPACKMSMQSVLYLCRSSRPVLKTQDGSQRVELRASKQDVTKQFVTWAMFLSFKKYIQYMAARKYVYVLFLTCRGLK